MPCNSEYMNPTHAEINSQKTCQNLVYLLEKLNKPIPDWVTKAAQNSYGVVDRLNESVTLLCSVVKGLNEEQAAEFIYDGRDKRARQLADWWEEHEIADAAREAKEKVQKEAARLKKELGLKKQAILQKLTEEERQILGV